MKKILEAQKKQINIWSAKEIEADPKYLGLSGSPTQVEGVISKELTQKGVILEGDPVFLAKKLLEALKEREILK